MARRRAVDIVIFHRCGHATSLRLHYHHCRPFLGMPQNYYEGIGKVDDSMIWNGCDGAPVLPLRVLRRRRARRHYST